MIVFTQSTAALSSETCSGDVHMPCRFPHDMHEPMAPPAQTDTTKLPPFLWRQNLTDVSDDLRVPHYARGLR